MNDIFVFFENFDMPAAAADFSDGNIGSIIYMNKKAREISHGEYKLSLENDDLPLLRQGEFLHRTSSNGEETFTTIIESDGKLLIFELKNAAEISYDADWANCAFCSAMQSEDPDESPMIMIKKVCSALCAEDIFIYEKDGKNNFILSHKYAENSEKPIRELSKAMCSAIAEELLSKKSILMTDNDAAAHFEQPLSDIPSERQSHSFAAIPIFDGGELCGFCCAENFPVCVCGNAHNTLETFCHAGLFIGSVLKWSSLFSQLKQMGLTDNLTGVGNRHAMNKLEESLETPVPLGLIYCDISGLKHINDTYGHNAGDEYIQGACGIMKKLFPINTLFRIGGDELLAVLKDVSETEVLEKTAALKAELAASSVAMAVGSSFGTADKDGFGKILREAEMQMYEDKTAYYKRVGRERRRF